MARAPSPVAVSVMNEIQKRQGAYLPHWTKEGGTYFVTFRTADSLPVEAVKELKSEASLLKNKSDWVALTPDEVARAGRLNSEQYERLLDNAFGACVLRHAECAKLVADALLYYAESQYRLWAWCVMPNHVHAVVRPHADVSLSAIVHGWKSVSSRRIGKVLGSGGVLWQAEYYDHLIRDETEFQHFVRYTLKNPATAGLIDWEWVGAFDP